MYSQTKNGKKIKKMQKNVRFTPFSLCPINIYTPIYKKEKGENPRWISTLFPISPSRIYFP